MVSFKHRLVRFNPREDQHSVFFWYGSVGIQRTVTRIDARLAISSKMGDTIERAPFAVKGLSEEREKSKNNIQVGEGSPAESVPLVEGKVKPVVDPPRPADVNLVLVLLERDLDALRPVAEVEGRGLPGRAAEVVGADVDPPALLPLLPESEPASWANPTDCGVWRNTEYTFFWGMFSMTACP